MDAYGRDRRPDLTRRAALAGAAAFGGVGLASMVGADKAFAATDEYFINAIDYGVVGNGVANDTVALQEAVDAAIEADKPLYLPPGRFRTTAGLEAEASNFAIFGAGPRQSVIVPDASTYDALTIGPGEGGSGNDPSGYARDFSIDGGNAEWDAAGTEPDTGKAAFKLVGMRLFEVTNVAVASDANFDIGFDLAENCFGCNFRNCRTGLNSCRVGLNIRNGNESGNDVSFYNCWWFGEVAAVHVASATNGFHFYGGQMTSSWQAEAAEDDRGVIILAKDYLTGASEGAAAVNLTFDGIDIENFRHCWVVRTFEEALPTFRNCSFNASAGVPALGFFKGDDVNDTFVSLDHNHFVDDFSGGPEMVVIAGDNGSMIWEERGSWGAYKDAEGPTNAIWEPLMKRCRLSQGVGWMEGPFFVLNGLMVRRGQPEGGQPQTLEVSDDWGSTWVSSSPSAEVVASANTIAISPGVPLVEITGSTKIENITPTVSGHVVVLKFVSSSVALSNGGNLVLPLGTSGIARSANSTLTLVCDGSDWYGVAHTSNI